MTNKDSPVVSTESHLLTVDIQCALEQYEIVDSEQEEPPSNNALIHWAQIAYATVRDQPSEITIRLVDEAEMKDLNQAYRDKPSATNVLSFPFVLEPELQEKIDLILLGDIVICHSVLIQEALEQHKTLENHYAHMITHGVLHLCGYDHQDDQSAIIMESLETNILAKQAISNPYIQ